MDKKLRKLLPLMFFFFAGRGMAEVVVIGNASLPRLDLVTIQKLFLGKVIEVGGMPVTAVNSTPGPLRRHFLASYLNQDEEQYMAYWTVRRFIGKGAPPRDLIPPGEIIDFIQATPGAVGYIDSGDLRPGVNVLSRK